MTIIAAPLALPVGGRKTVRVGISMAGLSSCWSGARPDHKRTICKSSNWTGGVVRITGSFTSTVKNGDAVLICLGVSGTSANGAFVVAGETTAADVSDTDEAARAWTVKRMIGRMSSVRIGVR